MFNENDGLMCSDSERERCTCVMTSNLLDNMQFIHLINIRSNLY